MRWLEYIARDFVHAFRTSVRMPALASVVIVSLAIGIPRGASSCR